MAHFYNLQGKLEPLTLINEETYAVNTLPRGWLMLY